MGLRASFGSLAPAVPGELSSGDLTVENAGDQAVDVRLSLTGQAAAWGWIAPATLTLDPGQERTARVTFKLPRAPDPPAGPLDIIVAVAGAGGAHTLGGAGGGTEARATLEVAAFVDVFATLEPQDIKGGHYLLTVENRGKVGVPLTVEGDGASVTADPAQLQPAPGATETARVAVRGRRGAAAGTFAVLVTPDGPGRPVRAEAVLEPASRGWVPKLAVVLVAMVVAGAGLSALRSAGSSHEPATEETSKVDPACPARDHLSPDANGIVREGVRPAFDYSFLFVKDGGCQPVRFNPCQPVRYALNRRLASDADVADLTEALAKLAAATGLEFQRVADTDEDPRRVPQPRRQADGSFAWPPVVIGWSHLGTGDSLRGRNDQRADPAVVVGGGGRPEVVNEVIVTGNLILNLDAVTDTDTHTPVPHGFGTGVNWGRIILHELAHVIGLGHVESRTSIMNEALTQQTLSSSEWGVGDLIGLRQLGREGGCVTVPTFTPQGAPR
jgi:hypothetical protein